MADLHKSREQLANADSMKKQLIRYVFHEAWGILVVILLHIKHDLPYFLFAASCAIGRRGVERGAPSGRSGVDSASLN